MRNCTWLRKPRATPLVGEVSHLLVKCLDIAVSFQEIKGHVAICNNINIIAYFYIICNSIIVFNYLHQKHELFHIFGEVTAQTATSPPLTGRCAKPEALRADGACLQTRCVRTLGEWQYRHLLVRGLLADVSELHRRADESRYSRPCSNRRL